MYKVYNTIQVAQAKPPEIVVSKVFLIIPPLAFSQGLSCSSNAKLINITLCHTIKIQLQGKMDILGT